MKKLSQEVINRTEEIIDRYSDMIYRIAFTHTGSKENAEDICQEVLIRFMKKCPVFSDSNHEKAWLIRVTINAARNLSSSAWMKRTTALSENHPVPEEDRKYLLEAVGKLPKKYRIPLYLH